MNNHIKPTLRALQAAALAASTDKSRFHLNGVFFQECEDYSRFVATDGQRMHITTHRADDVTIDETATPIRSFIIPSQTITAFSKIIKATYPRLADDDLLFKSESDQIRISLACNPEPSLLFTPVGGTFPDYRRVIPNESAYDNGSPIACYNYEFLNDFGKAGKLLFETKTKGLIIKNQPNANDGRPATVLLDDDKAKVFAGILMTLRMKERD